MMDMKIHRDIGGRWVIDNKWIKKDRKKEWKMWTDMWPYFLPAEHFRGHEFKLKYLRGNDTTSNS